MLVYSKTIISFIKKCEAHSRNILNREMGLVCRRTRFEYGRMLYPFHIVVFEHPSKLGYFDPSSFQIGLNKWLLFKSDKIILDILKHEWAHFLAHLEFGDTISAHGKEYRSICKRFNWGEDVYAAKLMLKMDYQDYKENESKILPKIQKLLALGKSSNQFEAELAMARANDLLIKHNLKGLNQSVDEEEYLVKNVLYAPRNNQKMQVIYEILKEFFVRPVFNKTAKGMILQVVGSRSNVELADYMAKYLSNEFENLWKAEQKINPALKGAGPKNSYFKGLGEGICLKLKKQRSEEIHSKELMVIEDALDTALNMAFPRLGSSSSRSSSSHKDAQNLGRQKGLGLNLRKGVDKNRKTFLLGK